MIYSDQFLFVQGVPAEGADEPPIDWVTPLLELPSARVWEPRLAPPALAASNHSMESRVVSVLAVYDASQAEKSHCAVPKAAAVISEASRTSARSTVAIAGPPLMDEPVAEIRLP